MIPPNLQSQMKSKIAGRFKMTAIRPDGTERPLTGWIDNLITNDGLERIGTGGWFAACHVGSGNNTPAITDTALQTFVGGTNTVQSSSFGAASSSPYYGWSIKTFRFAAGTATGNLSEVGIATAATNGGSTKLVTHALILDSGSSPTTITILSDEVLDVTYEMRVYPSTEADTTGSIVIGGVTYNYTIRPCNVTNAGDWGSAIGSVANQSSYTASDAYGYTGAIGAITGTPSGTATSWDMSDLAYSASSKYRDASVTLGLTAGNLSGGMRSIRSRSSLGCYQIDFGASIPKDNTKTLALTFRIAWDRV